MGAFLRVIQYTVLTSKFRLIIMEAHCADVLSLQGIITCVYQSLPDWDMNSRQMIVTT